MARPRLERFRWPILLLPGVLAYGVAGYMLVEGWSFLDALYMTILTLTTVGYREVRPLDPAARSSPSRSWSSVWLLCWPPSP